MKMHRFNFVIYIWFLMLRKRQKCCYGKEEENPGRDKDKSPFSNHWKVVFTPNSANFPLIFLTNTTLTIVLQVGFCIGYIFVLNFVVDMTQLAVNGRLAF